jgi:dipeptidyl aminopeptidase/acylaminoacyl peptidase
VWGWGYGGYVTAMLLGSQQNIFKCGIAVSPIADWLYYSKFFLSNFIVTSRYRLTYNFIL